jgi:hypothetical protein
MRIFGLFLIFTMCRGIYGQEHRRIVFSPQINGEKLILDHMYSFDDSTEMAIHNLKLYLSNVCVYSGKTKSLDNTHYHLMNLEDSMSFVVHHSLENVTAISFNIGLDSATNVSGILEGDLDPIHGMYWTWNSGYVNFKLEGTFSEKINYIQPFEYHLGGYMSPFQTMQHVSFPVKSAGEINIAIDVADFLRAFNWKDEQNVTVTGKKAKQLSGFLPGMFKLVTP